MSELRNLRPGVGSISANGAECRKSEREKHYSGFSGKETRMTKTHGVYEKVPGSGVWWVQYFDYEGRRRREKVGSKSAAKDWQRSAATRPVPA